MPRPPRSRAQILLALAVSVSSLTAIFVLGLAGFEPEAAEATPLPEPSLELHARAQTHEPRQTTRPEPAPAQADTPTKAPQPAVETPDDDSAQVAVPDVSGLRLWIARKRLADAGLKLAPKEGARRIPTDEYADYQIAEDASFGQVVEAGSTIEVQVEYWAPRYARGY